MRAVDRPMAKLIATKRLITGTSSCVAAIALTTIAVVQHHAPTPEMGLALLLLVGGGIWTLRDGLRLRRALRT